jgi:hypothetical protein
VATRDGLVEASSRVREELSTRQEVIDRQRCELRSESALFTGGEGRAMLDREEHA